MVPQAEHSTSGDVHALDEALCLALLLILHSRLRAFAVMLGTVQDLIRECLACSTSSSFKTFQQGPSVVW